MGLLIDRSSFAEDEYVHAGTRLRENLSALKSLLERPDFGIGEPSLGAELEMCIVGPNGEALPVNKEVMAASDDPNLQLELDRFNLDSARIKEVEMATRVVLLLALDRNVHGPETILEGLEDFSGLPKTQE